jgi:hypothetical protein
MSAMLSLLTGLAVAAAVLFAAIAWRLARDDRRRSAARVAALSAAIDGPANAPIVIDTAPVAAADTPAAMFALEPGASIKGRPVLKVAVVAVMAIVIVVAAAMINRDPQQAATAAAAPQSAALELMSMRHQREGRTLKVTGLVRNPEGGIEARRVSAVVFVFDRGGSFLTSGRAPLDFVVLEPGGESPFVVTIPDVADVARYRVSFRTDAGVVRHVDRRAEQLQLAGN